MVLGKLSRLMKRILVYALTFTLASVAIAQKPQDSPPDVSNKVLVTKNPGLALATNNSASAFRAMAKDYYAWRNENYPVQSSDSGLHTWDDRLTDYSPAKVAERAEHVRSLLERV